MLDGVLRTVSLTIDTQHGTGILAAIQRDGLLVASPVSNTAETSVPVSSRRQLHRHGRPAALTRTAVRQSGACPTEQGEGSVTDRFTHAPGLQSGHRTLRRPESAGGPDQPGSPAVRAAPNTTARGGPPRPAVRGWPHERRLLLARPRRVPVRDARHRAGADPVVRGLLTGCLEKYRAPPGGGGPGEFPHARSDVVPGAGRARRRNDLISRLSARSHPGPLESRVSSVLVRQSARDTGASPWRGTREATTSLRRGTGSWPTRTARSSSTRPAASRASTTRSA
jgi:hypothetical protein